jgi:hypothetical protein
MATPAPRPLSKGQRIITWVALVLFALTLTSAPWVVTPPPSLQPTLYHRSYYSVPQSSYSVMEPIWAGPRDGKLDSGTLLVEWIGIAIIYGGLFVLFRERPDRRAKQTDVQDTSESRKSEKLSDARDERAAVSKLTQSSKGIYGRDEAEMQAPASARPGGISGWWIALNVAYPAALVAGLVILATRENNQQTAPSAGQVSPSPLGTQVAPPQVGRTIVHVEGVGTIEFPGEMSEREIQDTLAADLPMLRQGKLPGAHNLPTEGRSSLEGLPNALPLQGEGPQNTGGVGPPLEATMSPQELNTGAAGIPEQVTTQALAATNVLR